MNIRMNALATIIFRCRYAMCALFVLSSVVNRLILSIRTLGISLEICNDFGFWFYSIPQNPVSNTRTNSPLASFSCSLLLLVFIRLPAHSKYVWM